jgi:hypothetical protein
VSENDGVEFGELRGEDLGAEVGSSVDDDIFIVELNEEGRASAAVVSVGGVADRAGARDGRNSHGGAGAEDGGAKWERRGQERIVSMNGSSGCA